MNEKDNSAGTSFWGENRFSPSQSMLRDDSSGLVGSCVVWMSIDRVERFCRVDVSWGELGKTKIPIFLSNHSQSEF